MNTFAEYKSEFSEHLKILNRSPRTIDLYQRFLRGQVRKAMEMTVEKGKQEAKQRARDEEAFRASLYEPLPAAEAAI